ncbi:hypothetical protein HCF85_000924 [Neisseria gonorrhoeae]
MPSETVSDGIFYCPSKFQPFRRHRQASRWLYPKNQELFSPNHPAC